MSFPDTEENKASFIEKYGSDAHKKKSDPYWDKRARCPSLTNNISDLSALPLRHLKTAAMHHQNDDVRRFAAWAYKTKKTAGYPE